MGGGGGGGGSSWPEFLASNWGKEFVAGGFGGMAGVISGHPLDTLRVRLQQPAVAGQRSSSAFGLLNRIVKSEGFSALYRGMTAPLASVAFQNAVVFQVYALMSRSLDSTKDENEPPSYKSVAFAGIGTGALQSLILSPVELVKIRLQLESETKHHRRRCRHHHHHRSTQGPLNMVKGIFRTEGIQGIYRGLSITALRDAPAFGVYFWTYEYIKEQLHPGCRRTKEERFNTMLVSGGLAGVASWVFCYPSDVIKSRIQAQTPDRAAKYAGVMDCLCKSVAEEGYGVLWRGFGTAVARAFVVNGALFSAYEITLKLLYPNDNVNVGTKET